MERERSGQEMRAEYCRPCTRYGDMWKEIYKREDLLGQFITGKEILAMMKIESGSIPNEIRKHVVGSDMCDECDLDSPCLYELEKIDDVLTGAESISKMISDRSLHETEIILNAYCEAMIESDYDTRKGLPIFIEKLDSLKIRIF